MVGHARAELLDHGAEHGKDVAERGDERAHVIALCKHGLHSAVDPSENGQSRVEHDGHADVKPFRLEIGDELAECLCGGLWVDATHDGGAIERAVQVLQQAC